MVCCAPCITPAVQLTPAPSPKHMRSNADFECFLVVLFSVPCAHNCKFSATRFFFVWLRASVRCCYVQVCGCCGTGCQLKTPGRAGVWALWAWARERGSLHGHRRRRLHPRVPGAGPSHCPPNPLCSHRLPAAIFLPPSTCHHQHHSAQPFCPAQALGSHRRGRPRGVRVLLDRELPATAEGGPETGRPRRQGQRRLGHQPLGQGCLASGRVQRRRGGPARTPFAGRGAGGAAARRGLCRAAHPMESTGASPLASGVGAQRLLGAGRQAVSGRVVFPRRR